MIGGIGRAGRMALLLIGSLLSALALCAAFDFALSQAGWLGLIADPLFRTRHPAYHHSLTPGMCTWGTWGPLRHRICTNSLGFKDAGPRVIEFAASRPRILFIGDSFTEGVGVAWPDTFAGRFADDHPQFEVLNAAVSSYSPTLYFAKVRALLDQGYRVDHVIAFIDISDIQDEASYRTDPDGTVFKLGESRPSAWLLEFERFSNTHFKAMSSVNNFIIDWLRDDYLKPDIYTTPRSSWTFEDWKKIAPEYGPDGVAAAIDHARAAMDQLHELLRSRGIGLSIAVYPWPGQIRFDRIDSLQARIWRDWCQGKCDNFIDLFPKFFGHAAAHPARWSADLFIPGDVHFNPQGHRMVAEALKSLRLP